MTLAIRLLYTEKKSPTLALWTFDTLCAKRFACSLSSSLARLALAMILLVPSSYPLNVRGKLRKLKSILAYTYPASEVFHAVVETLDFLMTIPKDEFPELRMLLGIHLSVVSTDHPLIV